MTEIEKMYENAGIEKEFEKPAECLKNPYITCDGCMLYDDKKGKCNNRKDYPPFTAEKQLRLIEWFISYSWWLNLKSLDKKLDFSLDFDEKLAKLVNRLWESFSYQEKEEIRGILNE